MKKLFLVTLILCFFLPGCGNGVLLENYNKIQSEHDKLSNDYKLLDDKFSELDCNYKDIQSELNTKNENLKKYEGMVSIESETASLENEKTNIEAEIKDLESERDGLAYEVVSLKDEIEALKNKKHDILSTVTLGQGQYIVGEDIDNGKYDVTAISGSGNFQGNIQSLGGYDYSLNVIMAKKGSDFWEDGYDTYNNLRLQDCDIFTISNGMKLQFSKVD